MSPQSRRAESPNGSGRSGSGGRLGRGAGGRHPPGPNERPPARRRADVEELVGEGLVEYPAERGSPAALALLSGVACLGTTRQAVKAEQAALELMERGVARPGWAEHAG